MTFFGSESEFDNHKIEQIRSKYGEPAAKKLESRIKPLRGQYSEKFVLTHMDLHHDNTLVRQVNDTSGKPKWCLSGIVDWARSGYYPEYVEYATAMNDGPT